jgi:Gas vesicle synthesis protein GvpL/GvpF
MTQPTMTMPAADEALERLRAALDELAAADARELLAQARVEAQARVRSMLTEALAKSMLEQVGAQLGRGPGTSEEARPGLRSARTPAEREPRAVVPERDAAASERRAAPKPGEQPAAGGELAWYVYAVVGTAEVSTAALLTGIAASAPLSIVREGSLAAVASEVPVEDFGEAQLRAHLADMDWVERTARRHEDVLDQLRSRATVIPMRMCTVYRTEGGIREMLRRESPALEGALVHLRGKTEWGVKLFADRAKATSVLSAQSAEGGPGSSGTAYMERKRREQEDTERAAQLIERAATEIHESLRAAAADGLVVPAQRPEASGRREEMVLNGVYLVEDEAEDEFHERARALQSEFAWCGIELEETGPWPAYNFVPGTIGAAW